MKIASIALVATVFVLAAWAGTIFVSNRFAYPQALASAQFSGGADLPSAGPDLTLVTWNIGYTGMGAEADFVMDLGQQSRPTDKSLVVRNAATIARPSWNTHGADVLGAVVGDFPATAIPFPPTSTPA